MNLTDNQSLAIAHLRFLVKNMSRTELEERLVATTEDYFRYQNNIKELAKQSAFNFLENAK